MKLGSSTSKSGSSVRNTSLWLALVLGLVAGAANCRYVQSVQGSRVTMYKAKSRLPAGTQVTTSMFDPVTIAGNLEEMRSFFVDATTFEAFSQLPLAETIDAGQPLMQGAFSLKTSKDNLGDVIPPGFRAVPLPVDAVASHDFALKINNLVDVEVVPGGRVLSGAKICALGGSTSAAVQRYSTISVLVPVDQVGAVMAAIGATGTRIRLAVAGTQG